MVQVRQYRPDDIDAILRIETEAFGREANPAPTFVQFGELYPTTFLVAQDGDGVVGYVVVARSQEHASRGLVIAVAVREDHRGRGIGRALLDRAAAEAAAIGISELELTVAPDNASARHLYADLGFSQAGELETDLFGEGEHRIRMRRTLEAACTATDENLQAEASTSVAWSNLLAAIAGAALAGLLAAGSLNPAAYWYVILALLGSLYSSQYYANVSGTVGRLHRNHDPQRLLTIGNALSEYLAFYPLVLALPLVVALLTGSSAVSAVAVTADLLMFAFYQLGSLNVESRQSGRRSSALTLALMSAAAIAQVLAVLAGAQMALYAVSVLATIGLVTRTLVGVRSQEE